MKLNSRQMAKFVAKGYLRFDAVVPDELNRQFLAEAGEVPETGDHTRLGQLYGEVMATNSIPEVPPGLPLSTAFRALVDDYVSTKYARRAPRQPVTA